MLLPKSEEIRAKFLLVFMIGFLLLFGVISFLIKNNEFFYYVFILFIMMTIAYRYKERLYLNTLMLFLMSLLATIHVLGGFIHIGELRLYDIEFANFKYDNLIHFLGSFIVSIIAYNALAKYVKDVRNHPFHMTWIIIFITMGVGAIIEVMEYFGVIFFNAEGVGGYFNNAKDLFFNLLGAVWGIIFVGLHNKKILKTPFEGIIYNPEKEKKTLKQRWDNQKKKIKDKHKSEVKPTNQ